MERHVHVGFGFHVNCYHSYRGDSNDALGFGGDIRIMRHIIRTLDLWNEKGVPVKGTWDFENAYSLEQILPEYAPDIIEDVRRRQKQNGDENILMGYNNGAMSAMTEEEFAASVEWAIHNEKGSGLEDVFGGCERIIRPQEVMFTPSQTALYEKAGIKAVCLYYSSIPFDAFRTLIPQLPDEDAFNPLRYCYEGSSVVILPTYSNSDLMDAGSLRWLATDLHEKQKSGKIDRDVFVFINIDADSFLWEPLPVPESLKKLPNFNGIDGLIAETADLPFVRYDTPGGYLKEHPPVRDIFFGEDVADGNFSGYASWAEKPFNRQIWSRLERARMYAERMPSQDDRTAGLGKGKAFEERIRLLSTTHFGLASPVMNIVREQKALDLSATMLEKETALEREEASKSGTVLESAASTVSGRMVLRPSGDSTLLGIQLSVEKGVCPDIERFQVRGEKLRTFTAVLMESWKDGSVKTVYLLARMNEKAESYELEFVDAQKTSMTNGAKAKKEEPNHGEADEAKCVTAAPLRLTYSRKTGFPTFCDGQGRLAAWNSWIDYDGEKICFEKPRQEKFKVGGMGEGIRFYGEIHLPDELEAGAYSFDFVTTPVQEGIFVYSRVNYPYTLENHEISSQASNLGRYSDVKWRQVAPMELTLFLNDDAKVEKRNFMQAISSYPLADFWRSFPQNEKIDSFNHQLTGGYLGVADAEHGLVLSHARQVLGSMAHCPMRLGKGEGKEAGKRKVSLNPFGTYFGKQRHYPSRGNGCVMELYNTTMPQARSIAPAYNGACERSFQLLSGMNLTCVQKAGDARETELGADLHAFADGAVRVEESGKIHLFNGDNVSLHSAKRKSEDVKKLKAVGTDKLTPKKAFRLVWPYLQNMWRAGRCVKSAGRERIL